MISLKKMNTMNDFKNDRILQNCLMILRSSLTDLLFVLAKMYFFLPKNHNFFGYPKIAFSEPPQKSEPFALDFWFEKILEKAKKNRCIN